MANDRRATQQRRKLSRAELKAYESRRAAERRRLAVQTAAAQDDDSPIEHSYSITRDDEYGVIKGDLIRLGWIVGILLVILAIATVFLA
jgi:hypothetical protein